MESTINTTNNHENDHDEDENIHQGGDGNHYIPEDSESQEESQIHNENLICRFYRKDFPDENDIVIVRDN
jgi:hypothetical protein